MTDKQIAHCMRVHATMLQLRRTEAMQPSVLKRDALILFQLMTDGWPVHFSFCCAHNVNRMIRVNVGHLTPGRIPAHLHPPRTCAVLSLI